MPADEDSEEGASSSDSEDESSCECKHSMDIMYDRQMSVTIAGFIGDMLKKEADKLRQERGGEAGNGQGSEEGASSAEQEGLRRAGSSKLGKEGSEKSLTGRSNKKGPGVRFSDDSFRDRKGRDT